MSRQMSRAQARLGSTAGSASLLVLVLACASVAMAQGQDEHVFTANQAAGTVSGFTTAKVNANPPDLVDFRVPDTTLYPGLASPTEIAIRPHITPYAYVTEQLGGSVSVIDLQSNQGGPGGIIHGRIPLSFTFPFGVAVSPDGHRAFVGNSERYLLGNNEAGTIVKGTFNPSTADLISVLNLDNDTELATINVTAANPADSPLAPIDVAYSPDGTRVYVLCGTSAVTATPVVVIVDTATLTFIGVPVALPLPVAQTPLQLAVAPDNSFVYVAAFNFGGGAGGLVGFDVPTLTTFVIPLLDLDGAGAGVPNPTDVFFNRESTLAYVVDAGFNTVQVVDVGTATAFMFVAIGPASVSRGCISDQPLNNRLGYVTNPTATGVPLGAAAPAIPGPATGVVSFRAASNVQFRGFPVDVTPPAAPAPNNPPLAVGIAVVAIQRLAPDAAGGDQRTRERREELQKGLCFVATASYGDTVEVATLRAFRDLYLMPTKFGASFVDLYYESSPGVANLISTREDVRASVRGGLAPLVLLARLVMGAGTLVPGGLAAVLVLAATLVAGRRLLRRRTA